MVVSDPPPTVKKGADGMVEFPPGRNVGPVGFGGRWGLQRVNTPMDEFAQILGLHLGGEVVNRTGLNGTYDFTLRWGRVSAHGEFRDPPLDVAVREQLGLTLKSSKGPTKVLVIDRMDQVAAAN